MCVPRSFAVWMRTGEGSEGWYLLFPEWGVAIVLDNMVAVSWDGRAARHCTCLPLLAEGDDLYSLFTALPANAVAVMKRRQIVRMLKGEQSGRILFNKGDRVMIKKQVLEGKMPQGLSKKQRKAWGKVHWVGQKAEVCEVSAQCVVVKLLEEKGSYTYLSHQEAQGRLCKM